MPYALRCAARPDVESAKRCHRPMGCSAVYETGSAADAAGLR